MKKVTIQVQLDSSFLAEVLKKNDKCPKALAPAMAEITMKAIEQEGVVVDLSDADLYDGNKDISESINVGVLTAAMNVTMRKRMERMVNSKSEEVTAEEVKNETTADEEKEETIQDLAMQLDSLLRKIQKKATDDDCLTMDGTLGKNMFAVGIGHPGACCAAICLHMACDKEYEQIQRDVISKFEENEKILREVADKKRSEIRKMFS